MATAVKQAPGTDIVALVEATPVIVLTDEAKFNQFYEAMREECDRLDPDLSTVKGRKAIASLAFKVARTKTAIDDAGKKLNEEARARINAVDEARRKIRQQLDDLRDEVRKPLTDWETAEEAREELAKAQLAQLREFYRVDITDSAADVEQRIAEVEAIVVDPDVHGDAIIIANNIKQSTLQTLRDAHARLVREEADRAELERLRAEQAKREAEDQARREAEEAEQRRIAAEKAEKERLEQLQRDAEEKARKEAEDAAAERERQHEEALAAERRRAEEAEAAAQAERDRAAAEERARQAEAERAAAEARAREADRAHRSKVMTDAKVAIMTCGASEDIAKAIVLAIVAGKIPHVSIRF